jgi:hypothetical protein
VGWGGKGERARAREREGERVGEREGVGSYVVRMTPRTRHLVHVTVVNITGTAVMTQLLCPGGVHIKRGTCPGLVRVTVWYARCVGHVTPRTYSVWVVSRREGDTVGDDLSHTSPRHVGHVQDHDRESEAPIRHAVLPLASGQWASHR